MDTLPFLENENSINIYLEEIIPFIALKEINLNPNQTNEMKFDWKNNQRSLISFGNTSNQTNERKYWENLLRYTLPFPIKFSFQ